MANIKRIVGKTGEDISYNSIGDIYNGRDSDACNVKQIIDFAKKTMDNTFDKKIKLPEKEDIIIINNAKSPPEYRIEWEKDEPDEVKFSAATFSRQKKIILTRPLPKKLKSAQTLLHELGHWCFDRYFDETMGKTLRNGSKYKEHSEAMAFYFEELLIKRNCEELLPKTESRHREGCELLRRLEGEIPQKILDDFKEIWDTKSDDECP